MKETCADMDRETVVSSLFGSLSKGKRESRPKRCANIESQTKSQPNSLNGKLNWLREEENWLSKDYTKLRKTRRWNIGKREILILPFWRLIRSLNPNDYNYNNRINALIRLKKRKQARMENSKWGRASSEKIKHNIAKKLKNWEEFVAKKQTEQDKARIDELSMHQERNPTSVTNSGFTE